MKKSTLTRFDNENIVFVEIENQEGTAKIIDEINNTVIDIGGGGGIANPVCTLTVINNGNDPVQIGEYLFTMHDEILCEETIFAPAETNVIDLVLIPAYSGGTITYETFLIDTGFVTAVASDLVNCTYEDGLLYVTDPTQDCSLTLTIS